MADEQKQQDQTETTEEKQSFDAFMEHQRKALDEAGKAVEALIPPDFRTHGRAAFDEAVEGFRVLINSTIDEVKNAVNRRGDSDEGAGKPKVKVDVE
ncbi:MAG: hypothetical protein ACLFTK_09290 [Anaerolineales bacterium]